jgi:hypothetical protein
LVVLCTGGETDGGVNDANYLPPDLQKYVEEDNERFDAELVAWDCEQRKKASRSVGTDVVSGKYEEYSEDISALIICFVTSLYLRLVLKMLNAVEQRMGSLTS